MISALLRKATRRGGSRPAPEKGERVSASCAPRRGAAVAAQAAGLCLSAGVE
jgi:hypothetical protein